MSRFLSSSRYVPVVILLIIHLFCERTLGQVEEKWSYDPTNPKTKPESWSAEYPGCGGKRQSPIDIRTSDAKSDPNMQAVQFDLYDSRPSGSLWTVVKNGHSVQFAAASWPNTNTQPGISRGGLMDAYQFVQLHLHWGSAKGSGSEHTLNGNIFPLEIHLVHEKIRKSSSTAVDGTGLAVVGIFFTVTPDSSARSSGVLQDIISAMTRVSNPDDSGTVVLANLVLASLLPDSSSFYRYLGSLTTPPCTESVIWTVMETPIVIPEAQMTALRNALPMVNISGFLQPLKDNHRPTQLINERVVIYCTEPTSAMDESRLLPEAADSGASGTQIIGCILSVLVLVLFWR